MFIPNKNAVHYFEAINIMYGTYVCKFSMSNCSFSKMLFQTSIIKPWKSHPRPGIVKTTCSNAAIKCVYYAIFHVLKRYSQQLVIYLLQFSLWFSTILSSDSGILSPISSISMSLTCFIFSLLSLPTRTLINGSTKYCFHLEGLTSLYINNTEEKRTRENYKKSQSSCS